MDSKLRWVRLALGLTASVGLAFGSISSRLDEPALELSADPQASPDPLTGSVLIDLDDSAEDGESASVYDALRTAIAPRAWPEGERALGEELSDAANLYRVTPPPSEVADVLAALGAIGEVEAVERERAWSLPPSEAASPAKALKRPVPARDGFQPNDPYYRHQWHMEQIGMPLAWATTRRGEGAVVAVVDTGVLYADHGRAKQAPDLAQTRFVPGYDFVDNDAFPIDEHGHGTHVAGTVAQSTNNGIGVAGVAPAAAIMPVRVLDRRGAGGWGGVAAGIRFAADNGANVINLSLGGSVPSLAIARAVRYAHDKGVTVVAAAGNTGRGHLQFPAGYPNTLAVGAVRFDGERSFYSSYGRGLGIMAPGGDLRVDQNGDGLPDGVLQNTMLRADPSRHDYIAYQGTSMAAPHVAGAAALLYGEGVRDPNTVTRILKRTAAPHGDANDYGAGLLRAGAASSAATRGLPLARLGVLALLGVLILAGSGRSGGLPLAAFVAPAALTATFIAGGFSLLVPSSAPEALEALTAGLPGLLEASPALGALLLGSVALPLTLTALFLSLRGLGPLLVGLSLGTAAVLLVEAVVPTVAPLGGVFALLVGPFFLSQAALSGWLARATALVGQGAPTKS